MRLIKYILLVLILTHVTSVNLVAEDTKKNSPSPAVGFWTNTLGSHTGRNSLWHLAAIGATGLMIMLPVDQAIVKTNKNYLGNTFNKGALVVGNIWHIIPAAIVYWTTDTLQYKYAAGAVVQAVGISFLVTTTEKFIVGRAFIDMDDNNESDFLRFRRSSDARDFYPFQNLIGFWPSGHTATAFATASALTAFYKNDDSLFKVAFLAYAVSTLMGFAMIDGNLHWASDVIAGALIGHAIGWTVGTDFRKRFGGTSTAKTKQQPTFIPLIANRNYGFQISVPL